MYPSLPGYPNDFFPYNNSWCIKYPCLNNIDYETIVPSGQTKEGGSAVFGQENLVYPSPGAEGGGAGAGGGYRYEIDTPQTIYAPIGQNNNKTSSVSSIFTNSDPVNPIIPTNRSTANYSTITFIDGTTTPSPTEASKKGGITISGGNGAILGGTTVNGCAGSPSQILVMYQLLTTTTLSNFYIPPQNIVVNFNFTTIPFTITIPPPKSNSNGPFTYTSSNTYVATVVVTTNNISTLYITQPGISIITATQSATSVYTSASITTALTVNDVPA